MEVNKYLKHMTIGLFVVGLNGLILSLLMYLTGCDAYGQSCDVDKDLVRMISLISGGLVLLSIILLPFLFVSWSKNRSKDRDS